jgi:ribosome maturation factor RimP
LEFLLVVAALQHLEPVFEPVIEKAGFKLVRLRIMGGAARTLQIMAERPDGSMDVEGCSELSHALLDFIETQDPIEGEYEIEVSSPGIDRPLTRVSDFARWSGHEAKIELHAPVSLDEAGSGSVPAGDEREKLRKRFRGILLGLDGSDVIIRADGKDVKFPFRSVANAKLVLTDKLIQEDLRTREASRSAGGSRSDQTEKQEK